VGGLADTYGRGPRSALAGERMETPSPQLQCFEAAAGPTEAGAARRFAAEALSAAAGVGAIFCAVAATPAWMQRHFLPDLLFSLKWQLLVLWWCRAIAAVVGVALLGPLRPRLGRYFACTPTRRFLADAAPILVAIALALGVSELLLRLVPALSEIDPVGEPFRVRSATLGWEPVPNHVGPDTVAGRPIIYATDRAGYRNAPGAAPPDPAKPTVLFAGESIMLGFGLNWQESIPAQVQAMTGVQSANLAVDGYATDQAYLRLRRDWGAFHRPAAVVFLYTPEVFHRNLDIDRPHLDQGLVLRPAADQGRLMKVWRWLVPYRTDADIERGATITRNVLQAAQRMAAQRGAVMLVLLPQFAPETPVERRLRREILDAGHIPYIVTPVRSVLPHQIHPDPKSAREIATQVAAWLGAHGVRADRGS
jgi:hypothetical protein